MHEKNKYRHIPWNRYNLEKYRDIHFWSYRPALCLLVNIAYMKMSPPNFCAGAPMKKLSAPVQPVQKVSLEPCPPPTNQVLWNASDWSYT